MKTYVGEEYDEGISFRNLSERYSRARKEHKCMTCFKIIRPGQEYYRYVGIVDGEFSVYKGHDRWGICAEYE